MPKMQFEKRIEGLVEQAAVSPIDKGTIFLAVIIP